LTQFLSRSIDKVESVNLEQPEGVDDSVGAYFPAYKGLKKEDSLCSLLFDLAADALAMMMKNATLFCLVKGTLEKKMKIS
jgi:hypothetical protein